MSHLSNEETPLLNQQPKRLHSPYWVVIPLFCHVLSFTLSMIPIQQWLLLYVCKESHLVLDVDWESCRTQPLVQATTARWEMIFNVFSNVPSLIAVPVLGTLSDRIGRKPIMAIPVVSGILSMLTLLIVSKFNLSLWIMAGMKFITGLMGSWSVIVMASFAYLADTTESSRRTSVFVYVEASFFLAFTLGPVLGGYLVRSLQSGVQSVFQITIAMQICVLVYISLFLKESLVKNTDALESQQPEKSSLIIIKDSLTAAFSIFMSPQSTSRLLMLSVMFAMGMAIGATGCFFLWAAYSFGWDSFDQGVYLFAFSFSRLVVMLVLFPIVKQFCTTSVRFDIRTLQVSIALVAVGTSLLGFATAGWMVLAISILDGLSALATPTLRGLLSKSVSPEQQGSLFSGIQVIQQLGFLVSSFVFPNIWALTVGTSIKSLFLWIEAFVYLVAFACTLGLRPDRLELFVDTVVNSGLEPKQSESIPSDLDTLPTD